MFPTRISYSATETYNSCPYKFYRQYISGEFKFLAEMEIGELNYKAEYGNVIHAAIEIALTEFTINDMLSIALELAKVKLRRFSDVDIWVNELKEDIDTVTKFIENIKLLDNKFFAEKELSTYLEIEDRKQLVMGIIDLSYVDKNGDLHIIDFKSGKKKSQIEVDEMSQLTFYTWLVQENRDEFDDFKDVLPEIFYIKHNKHYISRFRRKSDIEKLKQSIMLMLLDDKYEVTEQPKFYICDGCMGNYKCKYLDMFRSENNSARLSRKFSKNRK